MSVLLEAERIVVSHAELIIDCSWLMGSVKPLDVEIMKRLGSRVNLIPVVAKADTMIPEDLENFKIRVGQIAPHSVCVPLIPGPRSPCCAANPDLHATSRLRGRERGGDGTRHGFDHALLSHRQRRRRDDPRRARCQGTRVPLGRGRG